MSSSESPVATFRDLSLPAPLVQALDDVGYETPTAIQAQTIPPLLDGKDLLGHAPTGTGKTAAFALPLLSRLDLKSNHVQIMVLAPTRELAIQVAEAFQRYATHLKGFHVLPIYGGQDYTGQIRQLKRGVHVVVGTPGRVMDHMRKGTLKLDKLQALVLDEGDEMLRMGFIDDIEWILEQTPDKRQLALFSATMPAQIQRIARRHLKKPIEVTIKTRAATADTIRQRYWNVSGLHKLDALTRILEAEPFDAIIIFVRTRLATTELAEKLEARGHSAAALNGDLPQKQREKMIERLKRGSLDILVATDVAARGLDVERISHVINYDIPYDTEAYIHRIGRTGRAGRTGDAILFVTPRESRMLSAIERATRQKIEKLALPTTEMVNNRRIAAFHQSIDDAIATGRHEFMRTLLQQYQEEHGVDPIEIAAALGTMYLGDRELLLKPEKAGKNKKRKEKSADHAEPRSRPTKALKKPADQPRSAGAKDKRSQDNRFAADHSPVQHEKLKAEKPKTEKVRGDKLQTETQAQSTAPLHEEKNTGTLGDGFDRVKRRDNKKDTNSDNRKDEKRDQKERKRSAKQHDEPGSSWDTPARTKPERVRGGVPPAPAQGMEWFRIEAGKEHDVKPANIVGAVANEAGLDAEYIGRVEIEPDFSLIELPLGMPKVIFQDLRKAWVCGQRMKLSRVGKPESGGPKKEKKQTKTGKNKPKNRKNKGARKKRRETTQA
ncbi:MAG: DEAD/DEAH box helicase [Granulosicoccus sp.]|nr:DEAD/DEAH box helicase [Granulosicoccus sp.]